MQVKHIPLLLWTLGAGLWALLIVNRCTGDDRVVAVVEPEAVAADADTGLLTALPAENAVSGKVAQEPRSSGSCIEINRADEKELDRLPGVGPAIAQRIIDYRSAHGPFASLADLDAVKGIGPAMLRKLEGRVCF
jgi:comEA protein